MPGWQDDMDFDRIEGFAQHTVNNEGRREYSDAYARAKAMMAKGKTPEEIAQAIIREPSQAMPNQYAQVTMIHRRGYEAS